LKAARGNGARSATRVLRTGDCLAPRYLIDAVFDGHRLARGFEADHPERAGAIIRERQIWGATLSPSPLAAERWGGG
jgi:dimethylamine/trimethylamine dehydrogenase